MGDGNLTWMLTGALWRLWGKQTWGAASQETREKSTAGDDGARPGRAKVLGNNWRFYFERRSAHPENSTTAKFYRDFLKSTSQGQAPGQG